MGTFLDIELRVRPLKVADPLDSCIFLNINSMNASSGPPIGSNLGQYGIPAAQFCKDFNERTSIFNEKIPLLVTIFLFQSGTYEFLIELPATSFFLKRALNLDKCPKKPGSVKCGKKWKLEGVPSSYKKSRLRHKAINGFMIYEILKFRMRFEVSQLPTRSEFKRGKGTIDSMGIHILRDE